MKKCAHCSREIEPLTEFPNPLGKGNLCLECYAAIMEHAPTPTAEEVRRAFVAAVNV